MPTPTILAETLAALELARIAATADRLCDLLADELSPAEQLAVAERMLARAQSRADAWRRSVTD